MDGVIELRTHDIMMSMSPRMIFVKPSHREGHFPAQPLEETLVPNPSMPYLCPVYDD